jgi:hypothetical protein
MATKKTDDVFSLSSFDPAKFTDSFRDFAEKGAVQSKEAYAKMKTAAEEATKGGHLLKLERYRED